MSTVPPSLPELQRQFAAQIFTPQGNLPDLIRPNGVTTAARFDVYRNNTFASFSGVLQSTYPVIESLVGAEFFRFATNRFIHQYPSQSGDLHDFGSEFPEFLAAFEPAAKLVYLADVARLELAYHRAYYAAAHDPLDIAALSQIPPEHYEELCFHLHPSCQLIASNYPILRIWQINQANYEGEQTVDLNQGHSKILLIRRGLDVELQPLGTGEFVLLQAFADNNTFADACEQALAAEADFDVSAGFRQHVMHGTLVGFTV